MTGDLFWAMKRCQIVATVGLNKCPTNFETEHFILILVYRFIPITVHCPKVYRFSAI